MKKMMVLCSVLCFTLSGCFGGVKTVTEKEMTVGTNDGQRTGTYTGEVVDGIPSGTGRFEAVSPDGTNWSHEGAFLEGQFHGEGVTLWDGGQKQYGLYEKGIWLPNPIQFYEFFESAEFYKISEPARTFISAHPEVFPTSELASMKDLIGEAVPYKMLTKEPDKYGDKILKIENLEVSQVQVKSLGTESSGQYTTVIAYDTDFNIYQLYYFGNLEDIYDGDKISTTYGVPLYTGSFDNVGGGTTNTVDIALCKMEK